MRTVFDERATGDAGLARTTGETLDVDGYLTRDRSVTIGGPDYFGAGIEGTLTLQYDLTDIGAAIPALEIPAGCPPGLVDAPLPADAVLATNLPGLLTFTKLEPVAAVAAFYRDQLPALGWEEQPALFEDDTATIVEFVRGREHLLLRVTAGDPATRVDHALTFD
jgi:hypothetical protein